MNRTALLKWLPADKHDLERVEALVRLGYPAVESILYELYECVQDINWPIARVVAPFLVSIGFAAEKEVREIFRGADSVWKYWVIQAVIANMPPAEGRKFISLWRSCKKQERSHRMCGAAKWPQKTCAGKDHGGFCRRALY
ncbi:MAG: DUF5071 domain-containing protein [Leptospiraceae bacterium]|nr:DUF5071 domain-containing protein [Leptospiraceae bacterium]